MLADAHGNVVHLGERECSLQRRHQKVIEEAPSPLLDDRHPRRDGRRGGASRPQLSDYVGAGTVEFIVSADRPGEFFFLEMNTRLQVEHPVTEMVTGVDLVEWQVRVAAGEPLPLRRSRRRAHRARDRGAHLRRGSRARLPADRWAGAGVRRTRSGTARRASTPACGTGSIDRISDYDPMLAKVIAHGADRDDALRGLDRALAQTAVLGVGTNIDFLRFVLADGDVAAGRLDTGLLEGLCFEPRRTR